MHAYGEIIANAASVLKLIRYGDIVVGNSAVKMFILCLY